MRHEFHPFRRAANRPDFIRTMPHGWELKDAGRNRYLRDLIDIACWAVSALVIAGSIGGYLYLGYDYLPSITVTANR